MKKHDRKMFDKQLKIEKRFAEAEYLFKLNLSRMRDDFYSDMSVIIHNYEIQEKREIDDLQYELNEDANILIVNKPDEDNVIEYLHSYFDYDRIKKEKANVRSEIHAL